MATLKVIHKFQKYPAKGKKFHDDDTLDDLINYIQDEEKTGLHLIGGLAVNPFRAAVEMNGMARLAGKDSGVRARHFVLSFDQKEVKEPKVAFEIANGVAEYYADCYQIVFAVHINRPHLHIHFVMNSVSYQSGMKYTGATVDLYSFLNHIRMVLSPYGIKKVMFVKDHGEDI